MYQRIMVPLDGSELAECVLPHVESFLKTSLVKTVVFLRVVEPFPLMVYGESVETFPATIGGESYAGKLDYWNKLEGEIKTAAEEYLDKATGHLKQYGAEIKREVLTGRVAETIITYADKNKIDLILLATHGRSGVTRWIMGSVADRIMSSSNVPVLIVRVPGYAPAKKDKY